MILNNDNKENIVISNLKKSLHNLNKKRVGSDYISKNNTFIKNLCTKTQKIIDCKDNDNKEYRKKKDFNYVSFKNLLVNRNTNKGTILKSKVTFTNFFKK